MLGVCLALLFFGLGLFAALVLVAWEQDRSDRYTDIPWSPVLGTSVQYDQCHRPDRIETLCAYCRYRTASLWCRHCEVYHCLAHRAARYAPCTLAWRPAYARAIGSRYATIRGPVVPSIRRPHWVP